MATWFVFFRLCDLLSVDKQTLRTRFIDQTFALSNKEPRVSRELHWALGSSLRFRLRCCLSFIFMVVILFSSYSFWNRRMVPPSKRLLKSPAVQTEREREDGRVALKMCVGEKVCNITAMEARKGEKRRNTYKEKQRRSKTHTSRHYSSG